MYGFASVCLLLSGIAALTYQVTWVRLLGLSMGSTSAAISTVLAVFFLGLALGSYLAERITRDRIGDLKVYIVLELVTGLSGLLLLPALLNLDALMAALPAWGTSLVARFTITSLLLVVPTLCMGATFPVMASIMIRRQGELGLRMSQLYSLNTAGAVLGACLSGFVFIPAVGLDGSIYIAVALNLLIVVLAWACNYRSVLPPVETGPVAATAQGQQVSGAASLRALLVLVVSGFVAIATEVGWTKYLVLFAGSTIYGFAAILTIFLLGIAAGSWAIRHYLERMRHPEVWMAAGLLLLGLSLLLTRAALTMIPPLYHGINFIQTSDLVIHLIKYAVILLLLFVPTFLFGALFPLNLKLYCGTLTGVRSRIGRAYAFNTVASIAGSLVAGFWIIPEYGTDALLTGLALLVLLLPLVFLPVVAVPNLRPVLAAGMVAGVALGWLLPHLNYEKLVLSVGYDEDARNGEQPQFLYLKEGKAGVISMLTLDGRYVRLQSNGLNESMVDLQDYHHLLLSESILGIVPYLYHQDPKSAFVVGFGGGVTTRAMSFTGLESIHVVELEPAVVEAGKEIYGGHLRVLDDPRVRLSINDARNTLLVEKKTYDIIVAQPSHPWRAGAANVFTRDFFRIARSRLKQGGIFGQWINLFNMDKETLRSMMRGFLDEFPYVVSYANLDYGDLILFGSAEPLVFDRERAQRRFMEEDVRKVFARHDIKDPDELFWYFGLSQAELLRAAGDAEPNTDINILSEVRLSKIVGEVSKEDDPYRFLRRNFYLDIAGYLAGSGDQHRYCRIVSYYLDHDSDDWVEKAVVPLSQTDPQCGRSILYKLMVHQLHFTEAEEFYDRYTDWRDDVHEHRALTLADQEQWSQAREVAGRIADPEWRRIVQARLWYRQGDWRRLRALPATSNAMRIWRLAGQAQEDLRGAGARLHLLMNDRIRIPELLRLMVRYYGEINDGKNMDRYIHRLALIDERRGKSLYIQAERALEQGDARRALSVLDYMQRHYPDQAQTEKLRKLMHVDEGNEEVLAGLN